MMREKEIPNIKGDSGFSPSDGDNYDDTVGDTGNDLVHVRFKVTTRTSKWKRPAAVGK